MSDNKILNAILDKGASDANIKEGLRRREFTKDELRDALLARKGNETMDGLRTRMFPEALDDHELVGHILLNMPSCDELSLAQHGLRKPSAGTQTLIDMLRKREFGFSVLMRTFLDYTEPHEPHEHDSCWHSGRDYQDPYEYSNAEKDGNYARQSERRLQIADIMAQIDYDTAAAFFSKLMAEPEEALEGSKKVGPLEKLEKISITMKYRGGIGDKREEKEVLSDYEKAKIEEMKLTGLEGLIAIGGKAMIGHADAIFSGMFYKKDGRFEAPSIRDKTLEAMGRILARDTADSTLTLDDVQAFIDKAVQRAAEWHTKKNAHSRETRDPFGPNTDYSFYAIADLGPLTIKPLAALLRPYIENGCNDKWDENTVESLTTALSASLLHGNQRKRWAHVNWVPAIEAVLATAFPAFEIKLEGERKMGTRTNRVYDALTRAINDAKEHFQKETRAVSKRNPDIGFALESLRMQKLGLEVDLEGFKATVRRIGAGLLQDARTKGPKTILKQIKI